MMLLVVPFCRLSAGQWFFVTTWLYCVCLGFGGIFHIAYCILQYKPVLFDMRKMYSMKPQDILLLLKLLVAPGLSQQQLALALGISQTEVSYGLRRLKHAGLLDSDGEPLREACEEFLVHGLKYVFPVEFGTLSAGIPTAHSKPGFNYVRQSKDLVYVWPHGEGSVRGVSIKPIHPSFPDACRKDERLYSLSSLIEMIRAGRAREKNIAAQKVHELIMGES